MEFKKLNAVAFKDSLASPALQDEISFWNNLCQEVGESTKNVLLPSILRVLLKREGTPEELNNFEILDGKLFYNKDLIGDLYPQIDIDGNKVLMVFTPIGNNNSYSS